MDSTFQKAALHPARPPPPRSCRFYTGPFNGARGPGQEAPLDPPSPSGAGQAGVGAEDSIRAAWPDGGGGAAGHGAAWSVQRGSDQFFQVRPTATGRPSSHDEGPQTRAAQCSALCLRCSATQTPQCAACAMVPAPNPLKPQTLNLCTAMQGGQGLASGWPAPGFPPERQLSPARTQRGDGVAAGLQSYEMLLHGPQVGRAGHALKKRQHLPLPAPRHDDGGLVCSVFVGEAGCGERGLKHPVWAHGVESCTAA